VRSLLVVALIAACGKSSAPSGGAPASSAPAAAPSGTPAIQGLPSPEGAPPPRASGGDDRCEIHVKGDATVDAIIGHPHGQDSTRHARVGAATDYWMTEEELRMGLAVMAGMNAGGSQSYEANTAAAEEAMKKDPRMFLLVLECGNEQARLQLAPAPGSRYADVPYAPKKYRIAATAPQPGDFAATFVLAQAGQRQAWAAADGGTVDITRFDKSGIAGTFHFTAKSAAGDHSITVDGSFDYGCMGGKACE
jgi:hypothetical protein